MHCTTEPVSTKRPRVNSAYSNTDHVHSKMEFFGEHPYYASFYKTTNCLFALGFFFLGGGGVGGWGLGVVVLLRIVNLYF